MQRKTVIALSVRSADNMTIHIAIGGDEPIAS
jgi:hypothetical protein